MNKHKQELGDDCYIIKKHADLSRKAPLYKLKIREQLTLPTFIKNNNKSNEGEKTNVSHN